jgi:hypothetical protein
VFSRWSVWYILCLPPRVGCRTGSCLEHELLTANGTWEGQFSMLGHTGFIGSVRSFFFMVRVLLSPGLEDLCDSKL